MTAALTYNPRNKLAQRTLTYIQSLGVFTITPLPATRKANKQKFAEDFRTAIQHGKDFREGKMEFRTMDALLSEL